MHDLDPVTERVVGVKPLEAFCVVPLRPVDVVAQCFEMGTKPFEFRGRVDLDGWMRLATGNGLFDAEMDFGAAYVLEPDSSARGELTWLCDLPEAETVHVEVSRLIFAARRAGNLNVVNLHRRRLTSPPRARRRVAREQMDTDHGSEGAGGAQSGFSGA